MPEKVFLKNSPEGLSPIQPFVIEIQNTVTIPQLPEVGQLDGDEFIPVEQDGITKRISVAELTGNDANAPYVLFGPSIPDTLLNALRLTSSVDILFAQSGNLIAPILRPFGNLGTFTKVTTDGKGRVLLGEQASPSDIGAQPYNENLQDISNFTINNTGFLQKLPSGIILNQFPPYVLKFITGYNLNTNTPPLPLAIAENYGWFWIVTANGGGTNIINGQSISANPGDWIISDGTKYIVAPVSQQTIITPTLLLWGQGANAAADFPYLIQDNFVDLNFLANGNINTSTYYSIFFAQNVPNYNIDGYVMPQNYALGNNPIIFSLNNTYCPSLVFAAPVSGTLNLYLAKQQQNIILTNGESLVVKLSTIVTDWVQLTCQPVNYNILGGTAITSWLVEGDVDYQVTQIFEWDNDNLDSDFPVFVWG